MQTQIHVSIREVYGQPKAYPACQQAEILSHLVGTKTLTHAALKSAQAMGFELVYVDRYGARSPLAHAALLAIA